MAALGDTEVPGNPVGVPTTDNQDHVVVHFNSQRRIVGGLVQHTSAILKRGKPDQYRIIPLLHFKKGRIVRLASKWVGLVYLELLNVKVVVRHSAGN